MENFSQLMGDLSISKEKVTKELQTYRNCLTKVIESGELVKGRVFGYVNRRDKIGGLISELINDL